MRMRLLLGLGIVELEQERGQLRAVVAGALAHHVDARAHEALEGVHLQARECHVSDGPHGTGARVAREQRELAEVAAALDSCHLALDAVLR